MSPVPPDPQEEDLMHLELDEGFQWASVNCDAVTLPLLGKVTEGRDHRAPGVNRTSRLAENKTTDVGENPGTFGSCGPSALDANRRDDGDLVEDNLPETRPQKAVHIHIPACVNMHYSHGCSAQSMEPGRTQAAPVTQIKQEKEVRTLHHVNSGANSKEKLKYYLLTMVLIKGLIKVLIKVLIMFLLLQDFSNTDTLNKHLPKSK